MAYKLRENEEDAQSRLALDFDIILTPKTSVEDAIKALENMDNYGVYVSNMRNVASNKAIEMYFGNMDAKGNKISPATKASIERQRGEKFPLKTKDAIDAFVKSQTSKPNLLKYSVKGDTIVFPKGSNPAKDVTKKIIKTVMDSAGIDFTIKEKESVSEDALTDKIKKSFQFQVTGGKKGEPMSKGQNLPANTKIKKSELKEMIKEEIKEVLNSSNWTISNIQSWINEYFSNKNMDLELADKMERMDSAYGSKTMIYIYDVGKDYGLYIKSSKAEGAPRLNELDVIIGKKGESRGRLTNTLKITNSTGNKTLLYDMLDNFFEKYIKEGFQGDEPEGDGLSGFRGAGQINKGDGMSGFRGNTNDSEPKSYTVELKKNSNGPVYGNKTFYFVDPIYFQLKSIDPQYAEKFYKTVKGGWMEYNECVDLVSSMVNIKFVDEYSDKVKKIVYKNYNK